MMNSSSDPAVPDVASDAAPARRRDHPRTVSWAELRDGSAAGSAAERILSDAADQARATARAVGYASGWAEGRRAAQERAAREAAEAAEHRVAEDRRLQAEHAAAVGALVRAAQQLHDAARNACEQVEQQATALALQLAEEILGRELDVAIDPGADAVRRALALLPADPFVTVRLHPDDLAGSARDVCPAGTRLVADATLDRGDALVETDSVVIDARISTAVDRVREVLR